MRGFLLKTVLLLNPALRRGGARDKLFQKIIQSKSEGPFNDKRRWKSGVCK
jgi:hypothetical protein